MVQDRIIPCIYALLLDKSEDTYRRFFEEVRNTLDLEHSPQDIMTDFEIAAINAVAATFEGTEIKGCFFHLCSNLWKRIQRSGLQHRYIDDAEFANTLRMIAALAFVPPDEVEAYFEQTVIMLETFTLTIAIQSLIILSIPTLEGFVERHLEGHLFFHRHYGTCFIELLMKLREQITA